MDKETARVEAFSDGIFSVAITLLGLDIGIKTSGLHGSLDNQHLRQALLEQWPQYFAYFNSFASVLLIWMIHHRVFKLLQSTNTGIQISNGILLLIVTLVPFPTRTVSQFMGTGAITMAVAFYTGYFVLVGAALICLCLLIRQNSSQWMPFVCTGMLDRMIIDQLRGLVLNLLITLFAFFVPKVSLAGTFVMWIFWARVVRKHEKVCAYP